MKTYIILFFTFLSFISFQLISGDEVHNGGDHLLSRILITKGHIVKIFEFINPNHKSSFKNSTYMNLYFKNRRKWIAAIKKLSNRDITYSQKRLYKNGMEKAAIADIKNAKIIFNKKYILDNKLKEGEIFTLLIHETGHLIGVNDHDLLDRIGTEFLSLIRIDSRNNKIIFLNKKINRLVISKNETISSFLKKIRMFQYKKGPHKFTITKNLELFISLTEDKYPRHADLGGNIENVTSGYINFIWSNSDQITKIYLDNKSRDYCPSYKSLDIAVNYLSRWLDKNIIINKVNNPNKKCPHYKK